MSLRSVLIVGASLAGLSTARALRQQGFDGDVTLVGAEPWRPYDRPPLSKAYLAGSLDRSGLELCQPEEDLSLRWRLGVPAVALDAGARAIRLADGSQVHGDALVIATGAHARTLPGATPPDGVFTLRTVEDADALRARLVPGARLVVVGAGFIGAEVASTAAGLGVSVTVVEREPAPLGGLLGSGLGAILAGLYAGHGVALLTGAQVAAIEHRSNQVTAVRITDGRVLPADVVLVGIGARPAVDWLAGSGVTVDEGVVCDAAMRTTLPHVFAVGDCAQPHHPWTGRHTRMEHWTAAIDQPTVAVTALLAGGANGTPALPAPYFWSDQFGVRLQFAGHLNGGEAIRVIEGDLESGAPGAPLLAVYERQSLPVAILGVDQPRLFARRRRTLVTGP
ncbi:MAG: FAD-dependent oxidoreductase [Dactylosporangium sp.]|nr:FAD-dependent oxidoreductase [Dactylosporangium sp.]